jgi:uncharacterized protein (UPF0264 family)
MAQLLVSVRNPAEAALAVSSGAEILDLKEPAAGALGSVEPALRDEVVRQLQTPAGRDRLPPLSVALGELGEYRGRPQKTAELSRLQAFRFAKVGLAGTRSLSDWKSDWLDLVQFFPAATSPVAAAYADAVLADAPEPEEVLELAIEHSLPVFLLDTWSKTQGSLFEVLSEERLRGLRQQARGRVCFALAGSLSLDCEPQLRRLQPDIVALRGAVCVSGRNSSLSGEKVQQWKSLVSRLTDSTSLSLKSL